MKKLILISALLFSFNSWANERVLVGSVAQSCESFNSEIETIRPQQNDPIDFSKIHSLNYQHAFISYLSGRNASRLNNGGLKNLADSTEFVFAYVKNECTKYRYKKVYAVLNDYYDDLPDYIE